MVFGNDDQIEDFIQCKNDFECTNIHLENDDFFFDKNGYVALIGFLASQNQKVTYLKKVGDL
jgi:hypothetical protein